MNALLMFKKQLNQQHVNNRLLVEDRLMRRRSFRKLFSLLPDTNAPTSFDAFLWEDKKMRDIDAMHTIMTGEHTPNIHNTCPNCGYILYELTFVTNVGMDEKLNDRNSVDPICRRYTVC